MKPSERNARIKELLQTPGLSLNAAERKQYLNEGQRKACEQAEAELETLRAERAAVVNLVGEKLSKLREYMISKGRGEEFARFRFCCDKKAREGYPAADFQLDGWPRVGGVYQQPEDEREEFIDRKLKQEGLA